MIAGTGAAYGRWPGPLRFSFPSVVPRRIGLTGTEPYNTARPDAVTILAQIAERADEIDVARAEAAKRRAEERLAKPTMEMDFERARLSLLKSLIRLQVATRAKIRS